MIGINVEQTDENIIGELEEILINNKQGIDKNDLRWFHPEIRDYLEMVMDMPIEKGNTY